MNQLTTKTKPKRPPLYVILGIIGIACINGWILGRIVDLFADDRTALIIDWTATFVVAAILLGVAFAKHAEL